MPSPSHHAIGSLARTSWKHSSPPLIIRAPSDGKDFEAGAGDILVIKAGEIHSFRCLGDAPLVQLDVHVSPRFIQENLT
jgi:hypothetical protein